MDASIDFTIRLPALTIKMQCESQRMFSHAVQRLYCKVGRAIGMGMNGIMQSPILLSMMRRRKRGSYERPFSMG